MAKRRTGLCLRNPRLAIQHNKDKDESQACLFTFLALTGAQGVSLSVCLYTLSNDKILVQ